MKRPSALGAPPSRFPPEAAVAEVFTLAERIAMVAISDAGVRGHTVEEIVAAADSPPTPEGWLVKAMLATLVHRALDRLVAAGRVKVRGEGSARRYVLRQSRQQSEQG